MTALIIKILIDSVMILLLGATIFYCFLVNKRIRVLQDSKEEFAKLIQQFDQTTQKAQESIDDLQKMSAKVTDSLNERLDKANFLADDLAFMIEKGNKVADKVDDTLPRTARSAKTAAPPKREPAVGKTKRSSSKAKDKDKARESLMRVAGKGKEGADNVESMLERLGDKKASPKKRRGRSSARLRSRAEQELEDALKSGND